MALITMSDWIDRFESEGQADAAPMAPKPTLARWADAVPRLFVANRSRFLGRLALFKRRGWLSRKKQPYR